MRRFISLIVLSFVATVSLTGCYVYTKEPPPPPAVIIVPEGEAPPPPPPSGAVGPAR